MAAAFVVAEECRKVEALCQTFLKWGQVTFSQRGKATTTTKVEEERGLGTAAPVWGCVGPRGWEGCPLREPGLDKGAKAIAPATCVALDPRARPGGAFRQL